MRELTVDELESVGGGIEDELILGALRITGIRAGMTAFGAAGALATVGYTSYNIATYLGADELGYRIGGALYGCFH